MSKITISGWGSRTQYRITLIYVLREEFGLGLAAAKILMDGMCEGTPIELEIPDAGSCQRILDRVEATGAIAAIG